MRRRVQVAATSATNLREAPPAPAPRDAVSVAASLIVPLPPRSSRVARGDKPLSKFRAALEIARSKARSGDWERADGEVLVGLYAVVHEMVYEVLPLELEQKRDMQAASREASRVLRVHFQGDASAMVEFVKWSWERERSRAQWAATQKKDRNRMGWRLQFSDGLVTDYRAAMASKRRG